MMAFVLDFENFNLLSFTTIRKTKHVAINFLKFLEYEDQYFVTPKELTFTIKIDEEIKKVIVPAGFMTNGRTVFPRFLQKYFKQSDTQFDEAYTFHDFLYSKECINKYNINKEVADKLFLNLKLIQINTLQLNNKLLNKIIAYCEFFIVKLCGKLFYNL